MTRTDPHVSQFQRDVGQAMEALRMGFQSEVVLAEGYSVDLAMVERRIAIEVRGGTGGTELSQEHHPRCVSCDDGRASTDPTGIHTIRC